MAEIKLEDVNETLENGLKEIFENNRFNDLLKVMAGRKGYSLNNTLMIAFQKPNATHVMGYKEWVKHGRHVKQGEKGIRILAPVVKKLDMEVIDPATQKPKLDAEGKTLTSKQDAIVGYRLVSVFDVQQTEGKEIPSVRDFINRELKNDEYMSKLYGDFKTFLNENSPFEVVEEQTEQGTGGYFRPKDNKIAISTNMNKNDTEKFRVLIHEYAHGLLHGNNKEFQDVSRGHKEAQAESVAYVVSSNYGLDTSDISNGYIATWAKDMKLAKKAIEQIQKVANVIIDEINILQKDKLNEFTNENSDKDLAAAKTLLIEKYGFKESLFEKEGHQELSNNVLQLVNKRNGIVMTATVEFSEKTDTYYLRTNRNLIEPLSSLVDKGDLAVLNVNKLDNKLMFEEHAELNVHFEVRKIRNAGYVVQNTVEKTHVSQQFQVKGEAEQFQKRAAIGQALINKSFLQNESKLEASNQGLTNLVNKAEEKIGQAVNEYISYHSKANHQLNAQHTTQVAWLLMKNPAVKTYEDLDAFLQEHKNVSNYKNIKLENTNDRELEKSRN